MKTWFKKITTKATISTPELLGCKGLSGEYVILDNVEFLGEPHKLIMDFDGDSNETYIVHESFFNLNDVEFTNEIYISEIEDYLTIEH